jgi:hypothetical protein
MCLCVPITRVWPSDGTGEVPLNVRILIRDGGGDYRLAGPLGDETIADVVVLADTGVYRLEAIELGAAKQALSSLDGATDYTLYSGDTALAQFQTGFESDSTPPGAIQIRNLRLDQADVTAGDCGDEFWDVDPDLTVPDDAVAVQIATVRVSDGARASFAVLADEIGQLSGFSGGCGLAIPLVAGEEYTIEMTAIDAAGNPGPTATRNATVGACADITDPEAFSGSLLRCNPDTGEMEAGGCCAAGGGEGSLALAAVIAYAVLRRAR